MPSLSSIGPTVTSEGAFDVQPLWSNKDDSGAGGCIFGRLSSRSSSYGYRPLCIPVSPSVFRRISRPFGRSDQSDRMHLLVEARSRRTAGLVRMFPRQRDEEIA